MLPGVAGVRPEWLLLGVGVGVALLVWNRASGGGLVSGTVATVARLPVDVFYGGVEGITGGTIPDTRTRAAQDACSAAKAAGNCWEASFVCPALDYLACLKGKYF